MKFTPEGGTIAIRTRNEAGDGGRTPRHRGVRHRHRHRAGGPAPDLRPLPAGGDDDHPQVRRAGAGPGDLQGDRRGPRRHARRPRAAARAGGRRSGSSWRPCPSRRSGADGDRRPGAGIGPERAPARSASWWWRTSRRRLRLMARLLRGSATRSRRPGTLASAPARRFEARRVRPDRQRHRPARRQRAGPDAAGRRPAGAVPAIALTGYGMEEDIRRSREAGFTAHMTKPIDFTKLKA